MPLVNGRYVRASAVKKPTPKPTPAPAPALVPEGLDLEEITKTISSIKSWLKTKPSQEDAMDVFQYEIDHSNRSGAIGDEGCLTEYLEK